jgi:hypothetical protein
MHQALKAALIGLIAALGLAVGVLLYLTFPLAPVPASHPDFRPASLSPCQFKPVPPEPVNPNETPDFRARRKTRGVA